MKKQTQARVFLGIIVAILAIIIIASLTSSREDVKNEQGKLSTLEIRAASAATTTTIPITTLSTAPTPAPLPPPSTAPTPAPTNSS